MPGRAYPAARARQRGQTAIIALLLILGVGVTILVYNFPTPAKLSIESDRKTTEALARVKEALIGWSASRTPTLASPNIRPGELPCPDATNSGNDPGPTCSAGAIGRVPWKSLGIPEPKDSSGETLWYAVSGPFRHYGPGNTSPITSDTLGNLTVYQGSSATTLTSQAIAVVFAPGAALGAQNRDPSTTALCTTTGTTIARNLCAANYLEATGGGNNAQTGGNFIQAQASSTFNDRLLVITNAELMPVVEQRVAREMRSYLQSYKATVLFYPYADVSNGDSDIGLNRGRFPCNLASPVPWGQLIVPLTPILPNWLTNGCGSNGWASVIYYAAAENQLAACTSCTDPSLRVDGVPDTDVVLLTPGGATGARTWVAGYFEESENRDDDDRYVTPVSKAYNRDRIFTIP